MTQTPARTRRPRPPRRTARLRLTLLFSGMFLLLGTIVLVVVNLLSHQSVGVASTTVPVVPNKPPFVAPTVAVVPIRKQIAVDQQTADLGHLLAVSWFVLAITAVGSAVLGWFVAGRVLRPLREITETAQTISAGNLHERLDLQGPNDEFKQLGDTLDELLARLEASFEAQRRFVANASHELRTPLTLERTLLQVALANPDATAGSLRATCEELLGSQRDQERLLDALLTLASSERGLERREPVDLAALAAEVVARPRPRIERDSLRVETALSPAATSGDPALVERLIANLIDNAVDHNVPGGAVMVRTERKDDAAVLTVANTGPRIAASEAERLLEPFQRLGSERVAGSGHHGLGLSIVRAIAAAHGADLSIEPQAEGGLSVSVRFPD
jgi:signal transduction histidine kinase